MKGLRVVNGYVQVRIFHRGRAYTKNFGLDSPLARQLAEIHLAEKRKDILMGRFGVEKPVPQKRFKDVVPMFLNLWSQERDGDGALSHSARAIGACRDFLERLHIPFFGNMFFDEIRPIDVERWRHERLSTGVLGTSVNREQVPLSSIFSYMAQAVALERVEKFRLPMFKIHTPKGTEEAVMNPCKHVQKAETRKRERIATDYELKKLKLAFTNLGDEDGWAICALWLQSVLSEKDLRKLELGSTIDLERAKTGVPVNIPITVLTKLNWFGWRNRWRLATEEAGLAKFITKKDVRGRAYRVLDTSFPNLQPRDLRKTGGNKAVGHFDMKLVSQYFGHASVKTTEGSYVVTQREKMRPIAEHLQKWVEGL